MGWRPQSCGPEAGVQMSLPPVLIQDPPKSESSGGSSSGSPESEEWMAETERPFLPPQTPSKPGRVASGRSSALLSLPLPAPHKELHPGRTNWAPVVPEGSTLWNSPRSVPRILREEGSLPSQHPPKEIKGLRPSPLAPGVKTKWEAGSHAHTCCGALPGVTGGHCPLLPRPAWQGTV